MLFSSQIPLFNANVSLGTDDLTSNSYLSPYLLRTSSLHNLFDVVSCSFLALTKEFVALIPILVTALFPLFQVNFGLKLICLS